MKALPSGYQNASARYDNSAPDFEHTSPTVGSTTTAPLLSRQQAADFLGIKKTTLASWHCSGKYDLPCVKVGRAARYRLEDLQAFAEQRTRSSAKAQPNFWLDHHKLELLARWFFQKNCAEDAAALTIWMLEKPWEYEEQYLEAVAWARLGRPCLRSPTTTKPHTSTFHPIFHDVPPQSGGA